MAVLSLVLLLTGPQLLWAQDPPKPADKQVVIETRVGLIVMELFPELAPNHVEHFLKRVRGGFYEKTTFHRVIRYGIIQGGDPLSRDPSAKERYGTGGLNELEAEFNDLSHTGGTVSAVLVPGDPNSAGSQFFICVSDQVQLDGQFTAFGRVVDGLDVVIKISEAEVDEQQLVRDRIEILRMYERERPPPEPIPFAEESVEELSQYRVSIKTNLGDIELGFFPEVAPNHVRQFLRFAQLGLYDGTKFHRVVPEFVVQGGSLSTRQEPVSQKYAKYIQHLKAEFNDKQHIRGAVSLARGEDPDSGLDSFFIVLSPQPELDGEYTVFGTVLQGIETVDGLAQVPTQGETPIMPVTIERMTVRRVD
ncbi:MAG: peptidylprolyl isomerase [Acidobacteriota bacterium]|nr:MAG: peptidylprolyl isomerase [Acidobacteriota bacterium]